MTRKVFLGLGLLLLLSAMPLTAVTYPLTWNISFTQTGGPFITSGAPGFNTWVTPVESTNLGSSAVNVWFAWTTAQTGAGPMTWDNTAQQFERLSLTGQPQTAAEENAAFSLSLDPSSTDIPLPFGSGLTTSDSVPAFFVGTLAPGQTVDWDMDATLSSNIFVFYFGGNFVATPAPEPDSLPLLCSALGLVGVVRRRLKR